MKYFICVEPIYGSLEIWNKLGESVWHREVGGYRTEIHSNAVLNPILLYELTHSDFLHFGPKHAEREIIDEYIIEDKK